MHSRFRRSEPSSHLRSAFKVVVITSLYRCSEPRFASFDIQSHVSLRSAFRAIIITSQYRRLELSSSLLSFGVQSCCISFVSAFRAMFRFYMAFKAIAYFRSGIQSRVLFLFGFQSHVSFASEFRAIIITPQCRRLELSSSLLSFGVQSHCISFISAFRVVFRSYMAFRAIAYFRSGVQSRVLFLFGIQSHVLLASAFRAIVITPQCQRSELSSSLLSFGVQSHCISSISTFRAISLLRSVFGAIITSSFDVQSRRYHFSVSAFRAIVITS